MMPVTLEESRLALVLKIERLALIARYLIYFLAAFLCALGQIDATPLSIVIVTAAILLHNLFSHWVFVSRRYDLFLRWYNFLLYFVETNVIIAFSGVDNSDAFALYYLFVIGYGAYCGDLRRTLGAAFLCVLSFIGLLGIQAYQSELSNSPGVLAIRLGFFMIGAWLAGAFTQQLKRSEAASVDRSQALAASEATLRAILDAAANPIFVFDRMETVVEANHRACEYLGLPREELLGQRIRRFVFDDGTLPAKIATSAERGEFRGELILLKADGEERTVDFLVRAFLRDGEYFYVALAHDITEEKELREATRRANADLERLNHELRQVDALKTTFLATLSERIRSPLCAVLGYVEMMLGEELGELAPDQRKALQTCRRCALRIFRFLDEALDLRHFDKPAKTPKA